MISVEIDLNPRKIALKGWDGPDTPAKCRRVGAGKFDPARKLWLFPLDMATCRRMREVFGKSLSIGPALNAWAKLAIIAEKELAALASATDADLSFVPRFAPRIDAAMSSRSYQRVAASFAARIGPTLIADQPGLGKTLETLAAIVEASEGRPGVHLILCPSVAVKTVWTAEVRQWLEDYYAVAFPLVGDREAREATLAEALTTAPHRNAMGQHVFIVANLEMARITPYEDKNGKNVFSIPQQFGAIPYGKTHELSNGHKVRAVRWGMTSGAHYPKLHMTQWDTVVSDESQRTLIRTSGKPTQQRAGMMSLTKISRNRIALSGTPMRGKPPQLWGTLNWLRPDIYTSYWNYVERYWNVGSDGFSDHVIGDFQDGGADRMAADAGSIMIRRTKNEVLSELPAKQYAGTYLIPGDVGSPHGVWLEMMPAQKAQYAKLMRDGVILGTGDEELMVNGVLPQNMRQKQLCGSAAVIRGGQFTYEIKYGGHDNGGASSAKFEWLTNKLDELGIVDPADDEQARARIVVASQFTSLLDAFHVALGGSGVPVHKITGNTSMKRRDAMIADFQSDHPSARVFLINTQAAGVAVTLDMADDLVLLDETWIPDDQEQVEDRIHRASRMHSVTIHYLRMLGTIEEEIAWITAAREDAQKYILDGARGVDYARQRYIESKQAA